MIELSADSVLAHLRSVGYLQPDEVATAAQLAWGVSNVVLRIHRQDGLDWVIKQSRSQLRTTTPWFSRLDRIWREVETIHVLDNLLPVGIVPAVLFEDRENYWFAMEAIEENHLVWKQALLDGQVDETIASRLGAYLAIIHRETHQEPELTESLVDREVFRELRIDPFYRPLAKKFPDVKQLIEEMIEEMSATPVCLVLGDFSPKNILITQTGIVLVDFETGHRGDPAFDLGFFLSHLLLKAVLHADRFTDYAGLTTAFWREYEKGIARIDSAPFRIEELHRRTVAHLAGCMWARIDATSPVDYLPHESQQTMVREFCRQLLLDPPPDWQEVLERLNSRVHRDAPSPDVDEQLLD